MAGRKRSPAADRTIDLFTGKTRSEQVEDMLTEETPEVRTDSPRDLPEEARDGAVRWLGVDVFSDDTRNDVQIAEHPQGHAVMILIRANKAGPHSTTTVKLSRLQWAKLKKLARESG